MYLHEAMKDPDQEEFITAMVTEVTNHMDDGNYPIINKSWVPTGATILHEVCKMKRKQYIKTISIDKWKARLNIDGSRMKRRIHYDQTYVLVASWNSI